MAKSKYERLIEPRLEEIGKLAREGKTEREIAREMGVSYSGFRNYKNEYRELENVLLVNKRTADLEVEANLFKRAIGFDIETEITTKDKDGTTTKTEKKHIPGDVSAQIFWLTNRQPDRWKNKQDIKADVGVRSLEDFFDEV